MFHGTLVELQGHSLDPTIQRSRHLLASCTTLAADAGEMWFQNVSGKFSSEVAASGRMPFMCAPLWLQHVTTSLGQTFISKKHKTAIRFNLYNQRVGNCLGISFFLVWGIFFGFPVLTIFHAICSILELETTISTVCATVLSSNLSFSIVFSTVFATVCSMFCPFSMLFAAFLSWNLHFHRMCNILQQHSSQYLQDFGAEG